jgi:MFS family permease
VAPKAAANLKDDQFFGVLSVGIFVIGTAVCNIPSAYVFNKYGRYGGFVVGSLCLLVGGGLGGLATATESLEVLMLACFCIGIGVGFGQFYRFAALEVASPENKGWAVTTVLMGGCVAAFFGPTLGLLSKDIFNAEWAGSFFMMTLLGILNLGTVFVIPFPPEHTHSDSSKEEGAENATLNPVAMATAAATLSSAHQRPASHYSDSHHSANGSKQSVGALSTRTTAQSVSGEGYLAIYTSRTFVNATLVSAIAQILMLIMMITSLLKMNDLGFTLVQQALVLDFHFFAMFGTGFITSTLLAKYNIYHVLCVAWVLIGLAVVFFLSSDALWAFFVGDFLVGVGWNIMFSTGTVMLAYCYQPAQRHNVQSFFEIIINAISGIFTIVSGLILSVYGWSNVIYCLLVIFLALTLVSPVYGRYYADKSDAFAEGMGAGSPVSGAANGHKRHGSGSTNSDIECAALE